MITQTWHTVMTCLHQLLTLSKRLVLNVFVQEQHNLASCPLGTHIKLDVDMLGGHLSCNLRTPLIQTMLPGGH